MHAAPAGDLREPGRVASAAARHRIDDRPSAGSVERAGLGDRVVDGVEAKLRLLDDRGAAADQQVVVHVDDAEAFGRDIAEHGADDGHH